MIETMTARQRVTAAINHREPDRLPIDLGMYTASGISAFAYYALRKHLGLPVDEIEIIDGVQLTARVEADVLRRVHGDCLTLRPPAVAYRRWLPREPYSFKVPDHYQPVMNERNEWVVEQDTRRMRMPEGGYFFDGDWISFDNPFDEQVFPRYVAEAERIYKETDYFTAFRGFHPFFQANLDYFCDMITDPEPLIEENGRLLQRELARGRLLVEHMNGYVGAVCLSCDLGSQQGPLCRPDAFAEVVLPFLRQLCQFFHANSDMKVFLHSCGAIEPLLPLLIECGIDIINPVQISAAGMDPMMLKQKYGEKLVFWGGGVDTQNILGQQTPEAVSEHVRQMVHIFKPGGGFIFNPVHNIMGNVPPENILAAFDAAYAAG
jgi:uroporphyrinogen decarboxylase